MLVNTNELSGTAITSVFGRAQHRITNYCRHHKFKLPFDDLARLAGKYRGPSLALAVVVGFLCGRALFRAGR